MPPTLAALRDDTIARAKELRPAVDEIARAIDARDPTRARAAYLEARRRDRELQPIARVLAKMASSQLGAWGVDPDEASPAIGMNALDAALFADPPRWSDAKRATDAMLTASALLVRELEMAAWTPARVGDAISGGIYAFGARLDGSDGPGEERREADVRAEGGGVLRAATAIRDAAHATLDPNADAIDEDIGKIHTYLGSLRGAPTGALDLLIATGDLGAHVRAATSKMAGGPIKPPFAPLRETPNVTIATFPKMHRAPASAETIAAGEALFRSTLLSRNRDLGCASCHDPERAFSRGDPPVLTFDKRVPPRNAPSLLDVGYDVTFFWDGRASTLAAQIDVAVDRDMGGRWDDIASRVASDRDVGPLYDRAFHAAPTADGIREAIGAYEHTLVDDRTRFDRYVAGDRAALDDETKRGFDVFFGKARCSRCHRLPLTSGVVPPRFVRHELSSIGVLAAPGKKRLDPDPGRAAITKRDVDRGLFKVPMLRELAKTAPYFHNGSYRTLDEVIAFYEKGGGAGFGVDVPNADPDLRAFTLDDAERRALVAFLVRGLAAP